MDSRRVAPATGNYHVPVWVVAAMVMLAAILFTLDARVRC